MNINAKWIVNTGQSGTIKGLVFIGFLFLNLVSCLPKDSPVSKDSLSSGETYRGFTGIESVQTIDSTKLTLSWTRADDARVVAYNIYDSTLASLPRLIKTVDSTRAEATIANLNEGFYYAFRVRAVDEKGKEDSNTKDVVGIPYGGLQGITVLSSTSVRMSFPNVRHTEALETNIYCKTSDDGEYERFANIRNLDTTTKVIEGLLPNLTYTCRAAITVEGHEDNNTETISFVALGKAHELRFTSQPGNGAAGEFLSVQPVVKIFDENGNIVSGGPDSTALITLEISLASPSLGTVRGTVAMNAVEGVAAFTDIYLQESGIKILTARKEDTSSEYFGTTAMSVESTTFNITPGNVSPTLSQITIDPASPPADPLIANGSDSYTVKFALKDEFGNPVTGIKPTFSSNKIGDFLVQPFLPTDADGETSGSISTTIADDIPPGRMLTVSSPLGLGTLQTPARFTHGNAAKLAFTVQPMNSPAGPLGINEIKVSVQDMQGNTVVSGLSASSEITLSIASNINGATLTGTKNVTAFNGVATFNDLGIDITDNNYQLVAMSGALNPAYSNNFNVTAGIPRRLSITGATSVLSGKCSTAITIQLQDTGGNPAKAVQNTMIQLGGLNGATLYSSSTCGGSALGASVTFTPGTDTRVVYLRSNKVQDLTITGSDASSVLTQGTHGIQVTPNKLKLVAEAAAPAPPGTELSVVAGACSTAIKIIPLGEDGNPGQAYTPVMVNLSGIVGSDAKVYSDSSCTTELDATNISLQSNPAPNVETNVYLKDPKGEVLTLSVADVNGDLSTVSLPQTVTILPSNIDLTGPSSVVAGQCSTAFTVKLMDTLSNEVPTGANKTLTINGVSGVSATGRFYTSPSCSGGGSATTLVVPSGGALTQVYFKGIAAEVLDIYITDPAGSMAQSQTVQLTISPSALRITGPALGQSKSSQCAGPFQVEALDGVGDVAAAVNPITVNLSGTGSAGSFYLESDCETKAPSFVLGQGQSGQSLYFKGHYPENALTLTASDAGGVLTSGTLSWKVIAASSWLGTASTQLDEFGNLLPFRTGIKAVAARYDGIQSARSLAFSPDYRYLYVADYYAHRVSKYDYLNHQYVGWIGALTTVGGVGATGSNVANPSPALCVSTTNHQALPGWCVGGQSVSSSQTSGGLNYPWSMVDDGTYLYVTLHSYHIVSRFRSDTGEFAGWIGRVNNSTPTSAGPGGPATCTTTPNGTTTPGWCMGGNATAASTNPREGDGALRHPRGLAHDSTYLYVGHEGAIFRYIKTTGAFAGWIGMVHQTPTGGAAGCTMTGVDQLTPGWCTGGAFKEVNPRSHNSIPGGVYRPTDLIVDGNYLYVVEAHHSGVVNKWDKNTGAFVEILPHLTFNWPELGQVATDGSKFYFANDSRVIRTTKTGLVEGWMGKVANNAGMSGNAGCNTLNANDNTPGWCLGGTSKSGLDEDSFINARAMVYDGNGHILVGGERFPGISKFESGTGNFVGTFALESISPRSWSDDAVLTTEYHGFGDYSMYNPNDSLVVGDYLFIAEQEGSRVKKINKYTGELLGWVGGMTSKPTGGESALCPLANSVGPSPGWCLGANMYPTFTWGDSALIADNVDGIMYRPSGLASDGTWLFVSDYEYDRIQRFRIDDGTYGGWIGLISTSPTGGAPGCNGAAADSFTPGWCLGGRPKAGNSDGALYYPSGMEYVAGNLYVVDSRNHRISSYNAVTGAFNGWIGRVGSNPSSGCTFGSNGEYVVSQSGWCRGGTASQASHNSDRGGGFAFYSERYAGITSDGTYLYVTNGRNGRIDRIGLDGVYQGATKIREDQYVNTWETNPVIIDGMGVNCSYPIDVWTDGTHIYGVNAYPCVRTGDTFAVYKMDKQTGTIIGWKGGVDPNQPPIGGEQGCAGAIGTTPGWCQGGRVSLGLRMGQFSSWNGGIHGDSHFLYITDFNGNRVTRLPK